VYSCIFPGEVIRRCLEQIAAGLLNPVNLLGIRQLIVDEYQDLNPCDIDFVDAVISGGVPTFVAGDDDQSIYSFRFAAPTGIQSFLTRHPEAASHTLSGCFRCGGDIVAAATQLITHFAMPNRIPKVLLSLHAAAVPPEPGIVHRWQFTGDFDEAHAIAQSCRGLTTAGVPPREILILVSNKRQQVPLLVQQLRAENVEVESPRAGGFLDEDPGRFILAVLRIVCDRDEYIAHRVVLGTLPGVGPGTCHTVAEQVLAGALGYRDAFYIPLPAGFLRGRALNALNRARAVCDQLLQWQQNETLGQREPDLLTLLTQIFGTATATRWAEFHAHLPPDMTLEELRNYLWADNDEQQARILERTYQRLNLPLPPGGFLPAKVRIMTMHGAKGLNATVVFVPGLEEGTLPGDFRRPFPGLVLEAARLLYVSITRARAVCILSCASQRLVYGRFRLQVPSQFLAHTAGTFIARANGLDTAAVQQAIASRANLI
jgi:DNA helicase-2/ATP-dependent DNA helicase PcrA